LPDADLERFVDALATRIATFDRQTIADTKRLVNVAACRLISKSNPGGMLALLRWTTGHAAENQNGLLERGFCNPATQKIAWGDFVGR